MFDKLQEIMVTPYFALPTSGGAGVAAWASLWGYLPHVASWAALAWILVQVFFFFKDRFKKKKGK